MTPAQLSFVAGGIWLDSGVRRLPTGNELAAIADRLDPASDSLQVARACAEIALDVCWVMGTRRARA